MDNRFLYCGALIFAQMISSIAHSAVTCSSSTSTLTLNISSTTIAPGSISQPITGTVKVESASNGLLVFFDSPQNLIGQFPASFAGPTYSFQLPNYANQGGSHTVWVAHQNSNFYPVDDCGIAYTVANVTPPAVPQYSNQSPIWRFYLPSTGDHFLTKNYAEGVLNNYTYEGVAFYTYNVGVNEYSIGLYRCRIGSDHFVSIDAGCEGQIFEGSYGFVSSVPGSGVIPVHRFWSGSNHLATTNYAELAGIWSYEGILGYAPAH